MNNPAGYRKLLPLLTFFVTRQALTSTRAPSRLDQIWGLGPTGTLTICRCKNPRVEFPRPRHNSPKISFFHHRNQISNAHVHTTLVNS
jgi:hypothetical protein